MFADLFKMLDQIKSDINSDSIHYKVLSLFEKYLENLNEKVLIKDVRIINKFVFVGLGFKDKSEEDFIDIEITKSNLEIRGNGFEMTFFYDIDKFKLLYERLITSFFKGDYRIISYFGNDKRKEAFGVIWNEDDLAFFNNQIEKVHFIGKKITDVYYQNGIILIK